MFALLIEISSLCCVRRSLSCWARRTACVTWLVVSVSHWSRSDPLLCGIGRSTCDATSGVFSMLYAGARLYSCCLRVLVFRCFLSLLMVVLCVVFCCFSRWCRRSVSFGFPRFCRFSVPYLGFLSCFPVSCRCLSGSRFVSVCLVSVSVSVHQFVPTVFCWCSVVRVGYFSLVRSMSVLVHLCSATWLL